MPGYLGSWFNTNGDPVPADPLIGTEVTASSNASTSTGTSTGTSTTTGSCSNSLHSNGANLQLTIEAGLPCSTKDELPTDACFKQCQERAKCKTEQCRELTRQFVEKMKEVGCKVGARSMNLNKSVSSKKRYSRRPCKHKRKR